MKITKQKGSGGKHPEKFPWLAMKDRNSGGPILVLVVGIDPRNLVYDFICLDISMSLGGVMKDETNRFTPYVGAILMENDS